MLKKEYKAKAATDACITATTISGYDGGLVKEVLSNIIYLPEFDGTTRCVASEVPVTYNCSRIRNHQKIQMMQIGFFFSFQCCTMPQ